MENFELYNDNIKREFLESIGNNVVENVMFFLMKKISATERIKNKDLYEMDLDELSTVLYDMSPLTETASYNNVIRIEEYINWSIKNGYRKTNISPFTGIKKVQWAKQFVSLYKRNMFTRKDILRMCDELYNYVDKTLLLAMFEGIRGSGYSELLNLKAKDVEKTETGYQITIKDDVEDEPRTIKITEELAIYIKKADNEDVYVSHNGEFRNGKIVEINYQDSDKVFKKTDRGKQDGGLKTTYFNRKIINFKEIFGIEHLRFRSITNSGMLHMANEMYMENQSNEPADSDIRGGISSAQMYMIADHYNTPNTQQSGRHYRNITTVRNILSIPEFEEMYGYKLFD